MLRNDEFSLGFLGFGLCFVLQGLGLSFLGRVWELRFRDCAFRVLRVSGLRLEGLGL